MRELLRLALWLAVMVTVRSLRNAKADSFKGWPESRFPTVPNPKILHASSASSDEGVTVHPVEWFLKNSASAYKGAFNDEDWDKEWHAQDYRDEVLPVMDLNLLPVYRMGYTGEGITVNVAFDGMDPSHDDIKNKFVHELSYDMCDEDINTYPNSAKDNIGTLAGGVIAMEANNRKCGVGVAYGARILAVKFWCHKWDANLRSWAVRYKSTSYDIALHPWGGGYMAPHNLDQEEGFQKAIARGRDEKGLIYVFTAGSDFDLGLSCWGTSQLQVADVIVVSGASYAGKKLSYGEHCSAIMATAYALEKDGAGPGVVSTDFGGQCGVRHVAGTWLSGAFAAGIIALILSANAKLTHRDVMHIITMGAEVAPLANNEDTWRRNGKGFWVSDYFGFGLFNAENMVRLAVSWNNVPPKNVCVAKYNFRKPVQFQYGELRTVSFEVKGCQGRSNAVNFLEHIVIWLNIKYKYRGALQVELMSPRGTNTILIGSQPRDKKTSAITNWRIKSVHTWGEDPRGTWKLNVHAKSKPENFWSIFNASGILDDFVVELHGTATAPVHYDKLPRSYAGFRLPDGQTSLDPIIEDEVSGMDDVFIEPEVHPCESTEDCDEIEDNWEKFVEKDDDNFTMEVTEG